MRNQQYKNKNSVRPIWRNGRLFGPNVERSVIYRPPSDKDRLTFKTSFKGTNGFNRTSQKNDVIQSRVTLYLCMVYSNGHNSLY